MTIARVRELSKFGALPDVDPYNLPPSAWSMGVNVRFRNGSVVQAPVNRRVPSAIAGGNDSFTKVYLPLDTGADGSTSFPDKNAGGSAHTWTAAGNAQIDTAQFKFNSASLLLDGVGDWISTPDHADFNLSNLPFTIECFFWCDAVGGTQIELGGQCDNAGTLASTSFHLARLTTNVMFASVCIGGVQHQIIGTTQFSNVLNAGFHHFRVVREPGGLMKLYIDGIQEGSAVNLGTGTINNSSNTLAVGQLGEFVGLNPWKGWISGFKIDVGIARNTANFTPPTLPYSYTAPRFVTSNISNSGFDSVIIGYLNGRVVNYTSGIETDLSVTGWVNSEQEIPYTSCHLGDVFYVNRGDRVPWSLKVTDTRFNELANWDVTWRARILRACGGALCAFGVTEGATTFPTMVRTSEFALVNQVPADWNAASPTSNATRNILAEMEGEITDAQNMGEVIMIYSLNETWRMEPTGGSDVWAYHKVFNDAGAIGANCSVEVDKKHYVFGPNDIWVHDGVSKKSICTQRVRKFIFSGINLQKAHRCFVSYDRNAKTVTFHCVSGDRLIGFDPHNAEGCNRAAIYSYEEDNWAFDDTPFVFSGTMANLDTTLTYASAGTLTYETLGGSYLDQEDSLKKVLCVVGGASTADGLSDSLYAVDEQGPGSFIAYNVDLNATKRRTLEKDGIDLDGLPDLKDFRGYKVISSIFPQARFEAGAEPLMFSFGSADNFNQNVTFGTPQSYDADENVRCDFYEAGRYLFMRATHDDYHWFNLTGIDLDVNVFGEE